jgi:hypothetical protein
MQAIPMIVMAMSAAAAAKTLMSKPDKPDTSAQEAILGRQEKSAADERARLAGEQAARQRAAKRGGGFRGLLSEQRLTPESGLQNTLGTA